MTLEVAVIGLYRILGSLPALRWPLAGGLLAVVVDLFDLYLMDVLDLGGVPNYQLFDKVADQFYLAVFLVVALRWRGLERNLSIVLYLFRIVGFVAFEVTGERAILLLFPNVFEFWFLFVAALHRFRPGASIPGPALAGAFAVLVGAKEVQEWSLHYARLFDAIYFLDVLESIRRAVAGLVGLR